MIGGYSVVTQDVLPFSMTVSARESKVFGANKIGLERRGFAKETIEALHKAFRLLDPVRTEYDAGSGAHSRGSARLAPKSSDLLEFMERVRARIRQMSFRWPYGMIAGNGRFPLLALETARAAGDEVVAIAIKEEASPEIEAARRALPLDLARPAFSRLIEISKQEGITEVMMAGQVKHAKIFSSIRPDWHW